MQKWIEFLKNNDYLNIKKLIKCGEDINETNETGESVLALAIRSYCDFELLMLLTQNGADIYDFDDEGVSIFDMAVTYNNLEMVQYLLNQGYDTNKVTRRSGFTPLMAAACYGRVGIVKLLIENGANQNAVDSKGFRAVDFARKMNKKSVLAILDYDENEPINKTYAR